MIKIRDRVFVLAPDHRGYATVIGTDWARDRAINVRYESGAEDWVYQSWVTVLRTPEIEETAQAAISTDRLKWFEAVGDWLERFIAHGTKSYPTLAAQRKAWWDLYDEGKALLERKP